MPTHPLTPCPVLFEDRGILVVNKPAGVLSHPNEPLGEGAAFVGRYDATQRRFDGPSGKLWLIHRLDEDTSGVLLAAKTEQAAERCRVAFEQDRVRKRYLAALLGSGLGAGGAWLDHIATEPKHGRVRSVVKPGARPNAELHFKRLAVNHDYKLTLVEIDLFTGRTHQIRVQAARRRNPVAGDDVYGDFSVNKSLKKELGLERLFLHAHQLEILHPITQKHLKFTAPLADELSAVASALGWKAP
ncbi:MAG: RluA family pseudouridine synthase [Verrucomicrobiaceae bacterium]|nr:RluA family pseudouridine synthase [Verrucomicrobiaceae bacterium]